MSHTYYSPGEAYHCPRCNGAWIRFVVDANVPGWVSTLEKIKSKKIALSCSLDDYWRDTCAIKWICKECFECGVIV